MAVNPFEQFWKEYSQAKVVKMSRKDLAQDAFQIGMQLGMNLSKMFMVNDAMHPTEVWFNSGMAVQIGQNEMGYPVLFVGERKSNGNDTADTGSNDEPTDTDTDTGDQPEGQVS